MGAIPLPALHINPPEQQPNALEQFARIQQIRQQQALMPGQIEQQQQSIQAGALENQQRQQALKDQQAMTQAYQKWDGKDPKQLAQMVTDNGGSATARTQIEQHFLSIQKSYSDIAKTDSETGQNNLNILKTKNDTVLGAINAAENVPDEQLGQHLAATVQDLSQKGMLDQQHAQTAQQLIQAMQSGQVQPAQARQALDNFKKGLQSNSQQLDQAAKEAESAKNTAQAEQAKANTAKIQAEMEFYKKQGLAPGVNLDAQEAADWLQKNPGKSLSDFMKFKATLVPAYNFNLMNTGTTGPAAQVAQRFGMSPVSFDQAAEKYWTSGQLPPTGRGGPALALNKALMNRAAELHPEGSLAANSAEFKANQHSLESLQKNFDQVDAFEKTAGKNLDVFLGTAQKVIDSGNPLINRPLRSITGAMGGTDQAAFNTARTTALTEISKVLNSSNASGVLSDSARHEVEGLIGPNATLKQIVSAANILKQDMDNRHESYQQQISDIKGRMGGKSQAQPSVAPSGTVTMRAPNGQTKQVPADQVEHYKSMGAQVVNQ